MTSLMQRLFTSHPASVEESYLQHLFFASKFAFWLAAAAGAAFIHALIPGLFEKTASAIITKLYNKIHNRG